MDWTDRRIEIFAPFGEAFELMERILFRPFDIGKWFVIGFAAWLATFFGGFSFNYSRNYRDTDWGLNFEHRHFSFHQLPSWVVPVIIAAIVVTLGLIVLFAWLNSRGRFIFADCIVRNRAAIVAPWKEFRAEGNRYFVFRLLVSLCSLVLVVGFGVIAFFSLYKHHTILPLALLILLGVLFVLLAVLIGLITSFMVPVMYRQRCTAGRAFAQVWSLFMARPGVFVLFCLFYLLLYIGGGMVACIATCATCCLTAIPYLGTVVLLPVVMVLYTFPLCFLRQFGDPYDAWAGVPPQESSLASAHPAIPPVQAAPLVPPPPLPPPQPPEPPVEPPPSPPPIA
jgi:hypothetical protein